MPLNFSGFLFLDLLLELTYLPSRRVYLAEVARVALALAARRRLSALLTSEVAATRRAQRRRELSRRQSGGGILTYRAGREGP